MQLKTRVLKELMKFSNYLIHWTNNLRSCVYFEISWKMVKLLSKWWNPLNNNNNRVKTMKNLKRIVVNKLNHYSKVFHHLRISQKKNRCSQVYKPNSQNNLCSEVSNLTRTNHQCKMITTPLKSQSRYNPHS
jgi:hypothetical protein